MADQEDYLMIYALDADMQIIDQILLYGPMMPFQGAEWETKQRVHRTFYPHNPLASTQILGIEETTTTINGEWITSLLQTSNLIQVYGREDLFPYRIKLKIENYIKSGQLVQIHWYKFEKLGFISSFKIKPKTEHDFEWSITFDWVASAKPTEHVSTSIKLDVNDVAKSLLALDRLLNRVKESWIYQTAVKYIDGMNTIYEGITTASKELTQFADALSKAAATPTSLWAGGLAAMGDVKSSLADAWTSCKSIGLAYERNLADTSAIWSNPFDTPEASRPTGYRSPYQGFASSATGAATITADRNIRDFAGVIGQLYLKTDDIYQMIRSQANNYDTNNLANVKQIIRANGRDSYRDLAIRYYKDVHRWKALADYNKDNTSTPTAHKRLIIPKTLPDNDPLNGRI